MSDLWRPRSTCGADCLPGRGASGANRFLAAGRAAATLAVLLFAAVVVPLAGRRAGRLTARLVLRALGVRYRASGALPARRALVVANHVSWLDVLVLLAIGPVRLLAKREVAGWPLVGGLARRLGTVFVDRTKPRSLTTTVADVAVHLGAGAVVAVFPEGTTWCGRSGGAFRPALFQAAVDAGVPVVPVTLAFNSTAAAFVGDETLLDSVRRVLAAPGLVVRVEVHPPLRLSADSGRPAARRLLASAAHRDVSRSRLRWSDGDVQPRPAAVVPA